MPWTHTPLYDNDPGHGITRVLGLFLLLYSSPTLIATRSRTGRSLSAKAQAGGEVAVFLPLACHCCLHRWPTLLSTGEACAVEDHCLPGVIFVFLG